MTSTSGSGPGHGTGAGSSDPAAIVADIERTRDDLAVTLEEIVDRVSPKRVADRTREKVTAAVKDGVSTAKGNAAHGAGVVRAKVAQARSGGGSDAGGLSATVRERTAAARVSALSAAGTLRAQAAARTGRGRPGAVPLDAAVAPLPPVDGREVPVLAVEGPGTGLTGTGPTGSGGAPGPGPTARVTYPAAALPVKELAAGAVAALVGLLLLRRRHR